MKTVEMAWEWNWPSITDWHTFHFFHLELRVEHKGDHSPGFHLCLIVLGLVLLECGWYNIHHENCEADCEDSR